MTNSKAKQLKELQTITGVGKTVAQDIWNLGFHSIEDLKGQNAEKLYIDHNDYRGEVQDICMLYTFRCAIYYANTLGGLQDSEKLKWWNWMDNEKTDSKTKDQLIRKKIFLK